MSRQFPQYDFQPSPPKTAIYVAIGIGIVLLIAGVVYFVYNSSSSSSSTPQPAPSSSSSAAAPAASSAAPPSSSSSAAPSSSSSSAAPAATTTTSTTVPVAASTTPSVAAPYTKCADENGDCTFPINAPVFYYGNGKDYKSGTVRTWPGKTSIKCSNETYGFDPAEGTSKICAYAPANSNTWKRCSDEGGLCNVPNDAELSFFGGQDPSASNVTRMARTGIYACNSGSFAGVDPTPGVPKACSYKLLD